MKTLRLKTKIVQLLASILCLAGGIISINAQSTNVEFPTPMTTNEVNGKISARDLGDSRLTTHYYYFNGSQGDIFVKILTLNLDGDIDIFVADTLRPITKISVYSDNSTETGREIYLRKPEKLILRVEGRTPTDTPATYSIKFEGSFLAATAPKKEIEETKLPEVKAETESEDSVKVNSVGTIIKTPLKKTIPAKTTVAKTPVKPPVKKTIKTTSTPKPVSTVEEKSDSKSSDEEIMTEKKDVVAKDNLSNEEKIKKAETEKTVATKSKTTKKKTTAPKKTVTAETKPDGTETPETKTPETKEKPKKTTVAKSKTVTAEELTEALKNVNLVILFKDGAKIERPMNEVLRFGVDRGILTVVSKDGSIGRYSILDISKMTIE
jgi:hypothetical protein